MKLTAADFFGQPHKAITLIGMSGSGKTHLSCKLAEWGWEHYSCDYLTGTKYLPDAVEDTSDMSAGDITHLSDFVGQLGNETKGGIGLAEFRRRQKLYYDAECAVLADMGKAVEAAGKEGRSFVNDSSGSLCEVEDDSILAQVGAQTLFVYLKVSQADHAEILNRAISYPKPLYFPPAFLDERLAVYQEEFDIGDVNDIDPLEFLRWIFPHLFEARLPKYQKLADQYGVTLYVSDLKDVRSEEEFLDVIASALERNTV